MGQFSKEKQKKTGNEKRVYECPLWNGKYWWAVATANSMNKLAQIHRHDWWASDIEMVCECERYLSAEVFETALEWSCELYFFISFKN